MDQPKEYNKQEKTKGNIKILLMKINEILIVIPQYQGSISRLCKKKESKSRCATEIGLDRFHYSFWLLQLHVSAFHQSLPDFWWKERFLPFTFDNVWQAKFYTYWWGEDNFILKHADCQLLQFKESYNLTGRWVNWLTHK